MITPDNMRREEGVEAVVETFSVTGENVRALDEKNRLYVAGGWRRANATYIICEAGISAGFRLSSRR